MAKLSRWAIFLRVFLVTLIVGQPARVTGQSTSEVTAWERAQAENSVQGYYGFLVEHPSGRYAQDAIRALRRLGALQGTIPGRQIPSLDGSGEFPTFQTPTPAPAPAPRGDIY